MANEADSANERWLPIPGFEGFYEVSDQGRVRSLDRVVPVRGRSDGQKRKRVAGRILNPGLNQGRPVVNLACDRGRRHALVHRLVLEAFVGPCPEGLECRHYDDDRRNNRLGNLSWGTRRENMADRGRNGLRRAPVLGEKNSAAKLTAADVLAMRRLRKAGMTYEQIRLRFGISLSATRAAIVGETWEWLKAS